MIWVVTLRYDLTDVDRATLDTWEEELVAADASTAQNLPHLVSAAEVGDQLGISRQRVHQLQSTAGFPEPLYRLRTGPVWDARAIEAFATRWDRRPGRRASADEEHVVAESPSPGAVTRERFAAAAPRARKP